MRFWGIVRLAVVAAIVVLSAMNASWIAPQPPGVLRLIAAGVASQNDCMTEGAAQKAFVDGADYLVISREAEPPCLNAARAKVRMPKRKFMILGEETALYADAAGGEDWSWDLAVARKCYDEYFKVGWLGIVPDACKAGGAVVIPLDGQWKMWGWPKRFMARMDAAKVRVILVGPTHGPIRGDDGLNGLEDIEQLSDVPRDFTGYLWVQDIAHIGPAIRR